MKRFRFSTLAVFLCFAASPALTFAQSTWIAQGSSSGVWSNSANWTGGAPIAGGSPTQTLNFYGYGTPTTAAISSSNDLLGSFQVNSLSFRSSLTGAGGFTLTTAAGSSIQLGGTNPTINQDGSGLVTFSGTGFSLASNTRIAGSGLGNISFTGALAGGTNTLTIGNGTLAPTQNSRVVTFGAANTFSGAGGVTLDGGTINVANNGSLGSGTLNVTANGGVMQVTTALSGLSSNIALTGNLDLVGSAATTMTTTSLSGSGNLTIRNTSGLTIQSNSNAFTGAVTLDRNNLANISSAPGTLTLNGTSTGGNGTMTGASSFNIYSGGTLAISSNITSSTVNNNRIGDTAAINLRNGNFSMTGAVGASVVNTETVGAISGAGYNIITVTPGTGAGFTSLTAASLSRVERGTFLMRGTNIGSAGSGNVGNLIFTSAPTGDLVGGGGAAGTTSISILGYAIGDTSGSLTGNTFVTYGPNGIRALNTTTEFATNLTSGATTNARLTASTANNSSVTVNSLALATGSAITGTGTVNVTSGAILNNNSSATISNTVAFGSAEGNIFTPSALTISGNLTGTNGLTKSSTGLLTLTGNNSGLTGQLTVNGGVVAFNSVNALAGSGDIVVNGTFGGSTTGSGLRYTGSTAATINRNINAGSGWINLNSATSTGPVTFSGVISGNAGVYIDTTGDVALTGNNTYTGPTRVWNGNLRISSDANLGNGGAFDFGAVSTQGVILDGNWTTSRNINFSFSSLINTQSFNATWNGVVTSHASSGFGSSTASINKSGSGTLTLTAANTFGNTIILNANGGELRYSQNGSSLATTHTLNAGTTLTLDDSTLQTGAPTLASNLYPSLGLSASTVISDRVASTGSIALNNGATLKLIGNGASSSIEHLGNVSLTGANNVIQVEASGGQTTSLLLNNLSATSGSVTIRGTNLGLAGSSGRVYLNQFNGAAVTNGQFLGNVLAESLTNLGVIESAVYDSLGIRLATNADFLNGSAIQNSAPTSTPTSANFRVNPSVASPVLVIDAANTINALRFAPGGVLNYGGGVASTLTITSGSILTEAGAATSITNSGSGVLSLTAGSALLNFATNSDLTVAANLAGTGGVAKNGAGTLNLNGAYGTTGSLAINAGTVNLGVGVAPTVTSLGGTGGTLNLGANNLTIGGTSSTSSTAIQGTGGLIYNPTSASLLSLGGNSSFSGGITGNANARVLITNQNALGTGTLNLSAQTTSSSFSTPTLAFNFGAGNTGVVANNIQFTSAGIDVAIAQNNSATAGQTLRLTGLISGGSATTRFIIDETGVSNANIVVFDNAANTFTGVVRPQYGGFGFTSDGALGNAGNDIDLNSSGGTVGSMRFDANNITLNNGRTVTVSSTSTASINTNGFTGTITGQLTGTGGVTKIGLGSLILTNNGASLSNISGPVTVSAGSLLANNAVGSATGTGNITVNTGALFGGTGAVTGTVTVNGTLAPGASIESLESGALTMNSGSTYQWETLDSSSVGADLMKVSGALSLTNVNLDLTLANLAAGTWAVNDKLTLFAYGGTAITSGFTGYLDDTTYIFGFNEWVLNYNDTSAGSNYSSQATGSPNFITFRLNAVPEPSALGLVLVTCAGLGLRRRRRSA
jgi:fibronectin-binding autotransporter adhesin